MKELSSCLTAGCTLFTKTCLNKSVRTIRVAAGWALRAAAPLAAGRWLGTPPLDTVC